ncbi:MAG: YbaN family protein [Clostridiales bacterium]|jgi:uncharacterized membrane protein YbaN (DUF454 family)|nr:YbaN family protein [Clostridiales bacterium]
MKRVILIILGFVALGFGAVGIILPVLPTTPFVLCAAGCFGASSPALYRRLAEAKYFGEYVKNYKEKTGISQKARWMGIGFLWITLAVSAVVFKRPLVWSILATVGVCVTVHILTIRRGSKKEKKDASL